MASGGGGGETVLFKGLTMFQWAIQTELFFFLLLLLEQGLQGWRVDQGRLESDCDVCTVCEISPKKSIKMLCWEGKKDLHNYINND